MATQPKKEPKIVSAVAAMTSSAVWGGGASLNKQIEQAMSDAVKQCSKEGVSMDHPDIIRQRMLEARQAVLDRVRQGQGQGRVPPDDTSSPPNTESKE
jgi:hypothetical protein